MPKLVPISGKKLISLLTRSGFITLRIKGSHHFMMHKDKKVTTVVPVHSREEIGDGLLRHILRDIEMSVDEYNKLRLQK